MTAKKEGKNGNPALSLWALLARCSIYKILAVLAAMALAEGILFYNCPNVGTGVESLAKAVEDSRLSAIFLAVLGLVCFILAWTEQRLDAKSAAALSRLQLTDNRTFLIKTAYNIFCLAMLFMTQVWLVIWLAGMGGTGLEAAHVSPQRMFLAFYRIDFLHCLLPMAETGKWVRNLLLLLAFGAAAAGSPKAGKPPVLSLVALYALTTIGFVSPMGQNVMDTLYTMLYTAVIIIDLWQVRRGRGEEA